MNPATWEALQLDKRGIVDLSSGTRLRLSGPDATRYLNGQVTQDVKKLVPGQSLPSCLTNHKGQLESWVQLTLDPHGGILVSGPPDQRDFLPLRLEKYLIADDCLLEDITSATALFHVIGRAEDLPVLAEGEFLSTANRYGVPGLDLWTRPDRTAYWQALLPALPEATLSVMEVLQGIPAWGVELTQGLLPPEAGLDSTAIDYHKGCYLGQEVISRIRSVGRVNRTLTPLVQISGPPVTAGTELFPSHPDLPAAETPPAPEDPAGTPPRRTPAAGSLTRSILHPVNGQRYALAYLRRGAPSTLQTVSGPDGQTAVFTVRKTLDD